MNPWMHSRGARVSIATVLFLIVTFNSPPTLPSVPKDQPAPPTLAEIDVLEELAQWVLGQPRADEFRAFRRVSIVDAAQNRRQSFELFRSYGEPIARQALVQGMPYGKLIDRAARRHQIDSLLLASIVEAESGFNPYAISPRGALGLMQVMPETAGFHTVEDLLEPAVNIELGSRYIARLLDEFEGDVTLALAGYNAGPAMVQRYGGLPPFPETHRYVDRVLTRYVRLQRSLWQTSGATNLLF